MAFQSASVIERFGGVPSAGLGAPEGPDAPEVGPTTGGLCGVTSGDTGDGGSGAGCTGDDRGAMVLVIAFIIFLGEIDHRGRGVGLGVGVDWGCSVWAVVSGAGPTVAGLWDQGGRKKDRGVLWDPRVFLGVGPGPCCCVCDRLGGEIGDGECWAGLGGVRWGAGVFGEVWRCFGPDGSIFVDRFHAGRVGGLVGGGAWCWC